MMRFREEVYKMATPKKTLKLRLTIIPPLNAETLHLKVDATRVIPHFSRFSCPLEKTT